MNRTLTEWALILIPWLYPTLFQLPRLAVFPDRWSSIFEAVCALPLLCLGALCLLKSKMCLPKDRLLFLLTYVLFIALQLVALLRFSALEPAYKSEALRWAAGYLMIVLPAFSYSQSSGKREMVSALTGGMFIYLLLNIILRIAGVEAAERYQLAHESEGIVGTNAILSSIGISGPRVRFPMANSINGFGVVAGTGFLLGLLRCRTSPIYGTLLVVVSLITVVFTDTRSAIVFPLLACLLPRLLATRFRSLVLCGILLLPFSSLVFFPALARFAPVLSQTPVGNAVYRTEKDSQSGNVRMEIYEIVLSRCMISPTHFLIGYGHFGQSASGAGLAYSHLFKAWSNVGKGLDRMPPHNAVLSYLLDEGLLGVIVFLSLTGQTLFILSRSALPVTREMISILSLLLFTSSVESMPTLYFLDIFWIYLLIVSFTLSTTESATGRFKAILGIRSGKIV